MQTFVTILGWLTTAFIAASVAAACVALAVAAFEKLTSSMYRKAYDKARTDMARQIRTGASWFGEDVGAWLALLTCAEQLERDHSLANADWWREEWRNRVREWVKKHGNQPQEPR